MAARTKVKVTPKYKTRSALTSRPSADIWRHKEALVGENIANPMTELEMPESVAVHV